MSQIRVTPPPIGLDEGLYAGDGASENERVHVVCALVRVHSLEVHGVPQHVHLVHDALRAEHVARRPRHRQRTPRRVALQQRDLLRRRCARLQKATHLKPVHTQQFSGILYF